MRRSKLKGRVRSPNPAAIFTARLQAEMIRLATIITSVMSWIVVSSAPSKDRMHRRRREFPERKRHLERGARSLDRTRRAVGSDDDRVEGKASARQLHV